MSAAPVILQGVVKPDGTLELTEKVNLPPGPVLVSVQAAPADEFLARMETIWAAQRARGFVPRSAEEVEAERRALRDESEEEIEEAIRIHAECQRQREGKAEPPGDPT